MTPPISASSFNYKKSAALLLDFFLHSNNNRKAQLLFAGSALSLLIFVALGFVMGCWCFPYIYAAFIAKDLALLLISISSAFLIATGMAGFNYLAQYLKNNLYVDWRSWLTKKIIGQYLKNKNNYLEISRIYKNLDNPEQRIQEDIDHMIESFLTLSLEFIDNSFNFILYSALLWVVGGAFATPLLASYLVLCAITVGVVTSLIGLAIGKSLQRKTNDEIKIQANLRTDLQLLKNSAEEIAIEHAEQYHQNRLEQKIEELHAKTTKRLATQNRLKTFGLFNGIAQALIPFLAAIPLYFNNIITIDTFYSVGFYFSVLVRSLNWFIESANKFNRFKTSINRVLALQEILDNNEKLTHNITRTIDCVNNNLEIKNLNMHLHSDNKLIIKGLNLKFTPGVHTLIQAPSGIGKSSLFKAIAGTWLTGEGEIVIPHSLESLYFLPQKPTLPDDTLRNILAYPDSNNPYSDEELIVALECVGLTSLITQLNNSIGFKSLGEQQRIAFARVLLRKPNWVFLDEATASLDEQLEEQVYRAIKEQLPNTTIISIAHRSTVMRHHHQALFFHLNSKKEINIEEKNIPKNEQLAFGT